MKRLSTTDHIALIRQRDPELAQELNQLHSSQPKASKKKLWEKPLVGTMRESPHARAPLTEETIVLSKLRPSLPIHQDNATVEMSPNDMKTWKTRISIANPKLAPSIRAIGRIELGNHPSFDWFGTAWLFDEDIVVTNRHVAEQFARKSNAKWVFRLSPTGDKLEASVDFLQEIKRSDSSRTFAISGIEHIEPDSSNDDLAFLRLAKKPPFEPLPRARSTDKYEWIATVGYPARDGRILDQDEMEHLFGGVFDIKRLAPGMVLRVNGETLLHDCTTLGGNSGSPVLTPAAKVIAVHFAGRYREANYAVPIERVEESWNRVGKPQNTTIFPVSGTSVPMPSAEKNVLRVPLVVELSLTATLGSGTSFQAAVPAKPPTLSRQHYEPLERVLEGQSRASYADRKGYQTKFIGQVVPLPKVVETESDVLTFVDRGKTNEFELRYQHMSVVMSESRRMCYFSAVNIDGRKTVRLPRAPWQLDPRIATNQQIRHECYGNPPRFSRGHMTRREDPVWGPQASLANKDSMHVTNAVPQMQPFNGGVWLELEDHALQNARKDKMRISVFTGPVFATDDPTAHGVRIPMTFWKVIAFLHDTTKKLSATAYTMSQHAFTDVDDGREFVFGAFKTHQRPLATVERLTGLSFGSLTQHCRFNDPEGPDGSELRGPEGIRW